MLRRPAAARAPARSAERRDAILAAALDEFAARGFAAARLDDVAQRAGVAKGTIYLLLRRQGGAVSGTHPHGAQPGDRDARACARTRDIPIRVIADRLIEVFVREIYGTRRKDSSG